MWARIKNKISQANHRALRSQIKQQYSGGKIKSLVFTSVQREAWHLQQQCDAGPGTEAVFPFVEKTLRDTLREGSALAKLQLGESIM